MGHHMDGNSHCFTPDDDDENTLYILEGSAPTFDDLWDHAQEKWPGCIMEDITISCDKIHTNATDYDLYDSSDYTDYLILTISDDYFERLKKQSTQVFDPSEEITFEYSDDLESLISQAQTNWPGIKFSELDISSSANHCMGCYVGGSTTSISASQAYFDRLPKPAPPIEPADHFTEIRIETKVGKTMEFSELTEHAREAWKDENIQQSDLDIQITSEAFVMKLKDSYLERITAS